MSTETPITETPEERARELRRERERSERIAGLRALADLLEQHPELPLPGRDLRAYSMGEDERATLAAVARALPGRVTKDTTGLEGELFQVYATLGGEEGGVIYGGVAYRESVCERRQVGTKVVEREEPTETRTVRETVPVYEWDCDPILRPTDDD